MKRPRMHRHVAIGLRRRGRGGQAGHREQEAEKPGEPAASQRAHGRTGGSVMSSGEEGVAAVGTMGRHHVVATRG
ncbi:hypothetical protein GCM10027188_04270 [Lysobacter humi (ex Lee et al. 2017)]